jgi:hypothetical protein
MHRETAHTSRRSRSLILLLLALAVVAVFGIAASQALAYDSYSHGTATTCTVCHTVNTATAPTNAACAASACHTGYQTLASGKKCYTCHTPGQDMSSIASGAPATCTATCHLADGTTHQHNPHPDRGSCTTAGCHTVPTSYNNANGSPHHKASTVTPALTIKSASSVKAKKPLTISGTAKPTTLAGKSVKLTIQMKSGAAWKTVKSASAKIGATGAYSYKYTSSKKGAYQVQSSLAASTGFNAATSSWKSFKVN